MKIYYKKYRKHYKYKLIEPFSIEIDSCKDSTFHDLFYEFDNGQVNGGWAKITPFGALEIKEGYAWDGPSGPSLDTKNFMRGSLVHDALYQLIRERILSKKYRKMADKEMRKINLIDGMSKFRAWYTYLAVRMFGFFFVKRNRKTNEIISAP